MATITITPEQLAQLQAKVQTLGTDKSDADQKTQASNQADAEAITAQAKASQAKLDETASDRKVSNDLADLQVFIDALAQGTPPPPPPPAGGPPSALLRH